MMPFRIHVFGIACFVSCLGAIAFVGAQEGVPDETVGSPLARPAVLNAPFSATATTTVKQTLADGTRVDHTSSAHYYRDSAGRVRIEQTIRAAGDQRASAGRTFVILASEPTRGGVYAVEPLTRTFHTSSRGIAALLFNGRSTFAFPVAPNQFLLFRPQDWRTDNFAHPVTYTTREEALGTRSIAGVQSVGTRVTLTIPVGEIGNTQSIDIIGDLWESPELKVLLYSRYSNRETGLFEYRLTNISRSNPAPELFSLPQDYVQRAPGIESAAMTLHYWPRSARSRTLGAVRYTQ